MKLHPPQGIRPALILLVLSLLGIAVHIADELIEGESFALDSRLLLALRVPGHLDAPIGPAWLLQSAIDVSALGGVTLMVLIGGAGIGLLLAHRRRLEALWIAGAMIGSLLVDTALKDWIRRPRPELVPHLAQVTTLSFPSGHAMVSSCVYLTLAFMLGEDRPHDRRRYVALAVAVIALIGASRVFLGVHWPSDVVAGWSLGTVLALLGLWLKRRWAPN